MSDESAIFHKLISSLDAKLSVFLVEIRKGVGDFMSVEHYYGGRYAKVLVRPRALSRSVFDAAVETLIHFPGWSIRIHVLAPSKQDRPLPEFEVGSSSENPLRFERYLVEHRTKLGEWGAA